MAELKPVAGRPYIVFHDAYQYLERRYGLANVGAVTINPEVPPSAKRLSQIRTRLATSGIVCVFGEPQFPPRAIETIIESTTVRRGTLDPLGAALGSGPSHYFEVLEGLARDLTACLAPAG
jgi:zinc transport system substrate-binding protein